MYLERVKQRESIHGEYEVFERWECRVRRSGKTFKDIVKECTKSVYDRRREEEQGVTGGIKLA